MGMSMRKAPNGADVVRIRYGSDTAYMAWRGEKASAAILIHTGEHGDDWSPTRYQTADARHRLQDAVRLVVPLLWGPLYETEEEAITAGYDPAENAVSTWDGVAYRYVE